MLGRQFPKLEAMLREAAEDLLAFTSFPPKRAMLLAMSVEYGK